MPYKILSGGNREISPFSVPLLGTLCNFFPKTFGGFAQIVYLCNRVG